MQSNQPWRVSLLILLDDEFKAGDLLMLPSFCVVAARDYRRPGPMLLHSSGVSRQREEQATVLRNCSSGSRFIRFVLSLYL